MYPFPTLPPRLSREIFAALRQALPNPTEDTEDAQDARDIIAMAAIAALDPIDVAEAMLAVQVVATEAHARDALRLASLPGVDLACILRCRAQAASMMRQMHQALRALHRMQAARALATPAQPDLVAPDHAPPNVVALPTKPAAARQSAGTPAASASDPGPRPRGPVAVPAAPSLAASPRPPAPHPGTLGLPRFAWDWVRPGIRQTSP
jgi:hypothetical protein